MNFQFKRGDKLEQYMEYFGNLVTSNTIIKSMNTKLTISGEEIRATPPLEINYRISTDVLIKVVNRPNA